MLSKNQKGLGGSIKAFEPTTAVFFAVERSGVPFTFPSDVHTALQPLQLNSTLGRMSSESELGKWPRRLATAIVIAWIFELVTAFAFSGVDALLLAGLIGVIRVALCMIGAIAGIGFLAAAIMEHNRCAVVWSIILLLVAGLPFLVAGFLRV